MGTVIETKETFNQWTATAVLLFKYYIVHLRKLRLISTQCHLWHAFTEEFYWTHNLQCFRMAAIN